MRSSHCMRSEHRQLPGHSQHQVNQSRNHYSLHSRPCGSERKWRGSRRELTRQQYITSSQHSVEHGLDMHLRDHYACSNQLRVGGGFAGSTCLARSHPETLLERRINCHLHHARSRDHPTMPLHPPSHSVSHKQRPFHSIAAPSHPASHFEYKEWRAIFQGIKYTTDAHTNTQQPDVYARRREQPEGTQGLNKSVAPPLS